MNENSQYRCEVAREVLEHALAVSCAQQAVDSGDAEPEDHESLAKSTAYLASAAPVLARAVDRVAKLAEAMDQYADTLEDKAGDDDEQYIRATRIAARSILAELCKTHA